MTNENTLRKKVLNELAPGTLFRGFFLVGFDPTAGRQWYFNFLDEDCDNREQVSACFYPTVLRYFQSPIEKLEPLSLSFVEGAEIGLILDVADITDLEESSVAQWYLKRMKKKSSSILAVEVYLSVTKRVGTFLVEIDESSRKASIV